jgi:hypothetical protein
MFRLCILVFCLMEVMADRPVDLLSGTIDKSFYFAGDTALNFGHEADSHDLSEVGFCNLAYWGQFHDGI